MLLYFIVYCLPDTEFWCTILNAIMRSVCGVFDFASHILNGLNASVMYLDVSYSNSCIVCVSLIIRKLKGIIHYIYIIIILKYYINHIPGVCVYVFVCVFVLRSHGSVSHHQSSVHPPFDFSCGRLGVGVSASVVCVCFQSLWFDLSHPFCLFVCYCLFVHVIHLPPSYVYIYLYRFMNKPSVSTSISYHLRTYILFARRFLLLLLPIIKHIMQHYSRGVFLFVWMVY